MKGKKFKGSFNSEVERNEIVVRSRMCKNSMLGGCIFRGHKCHMFDHCNIRLAEVRKHEKMATSQS